VSVREERSIVAVQAVCHDGQTTRTAREELVLEEPLEIRVAGDALGLTMRTPGDDRFLAVGFLFAEGVLSGLDDVGGVYHCGRTDDPRYGNAIEVTPGPGAQLDIERLLRARRVGLTTSACGVCGRDGIDDLLARLSPLRVSQQSIAASLLLQVPALLARGQSVFARTGDVLAEAEDVGRHNAVDKVVGRLLYAGALPAHAHPVTPHVLAVSGRASFEIVQKAAMAGFSCVASVSAPSSLSVSTAHAAGLTLAAFVREGRFTLYAHPERVY
jgi:FdhD protein